MRFALPLLFVAFAGCGEPYPHIQLTCTTTCGVSTPQANRCAELVDWEARSTEFLSSVYGTDVCPLMQGVVVNLVESYTARWDGKAYQGMAFKEERSIYLSRSMRGQTRQFFAHEMVHILDWELLGVFEPAHDSWYGPRDIARRLNVMGREDFLASGSP